MGSSVRQVPKPPFPLPLPSRLLLRKGRRDREEGNDGGGRNIELGNAGEGGGREGKKGDREKEDFAAGGNASGT